MEELPVFDETACIDFIFDKLVAMGRVVTKDDIDLIMGLEVEYMVKVGIAVPIEG